MEEIVEFSIQSGIALNDALNTPLWFKNAYYSAGGWNIKKAHLEKHDQMMTNIEQMLINLGIGIKNTNRMVASLGQ